VRRPGPALAALGALLLLTSAPAALAKTTTQTASAGIVSATYTFQGTYPNFSHESLVIKRSGQVFYNQPVNFAGVCGTECAPGSTSAKHPSVQILDIEHDGRPNVILSLYSGGANCCVLDQVFSYDPGTMTYSKAQRNFGDLGASLKDLSHNGIDEFVGANPAFKYEFTDGVASGEPLQILSFAGGKFKDVTRTYPKLIAKDAARWLKYFKQQIKGSKSQIDSVGVIAAWAADEDELGQSKQVASYLQKEASAGLLRSPVEAGGQKFITHLNKFLHKEGYLK
jgi:hypothetical protein